MLNTAGVLARTFRLKSESTGDITNWLMPNADAINSGNCFRVSKDVVVYVTFTNAFLPHIVVVEPEQHFVLMSSLHFSMVLLSASANVSRYEQVSRYDRSADTT